MSVKIKLEKDGFIKDGFVGYSYTSACLDFWVPAFRIDFNAFIFFFGIYMLEKFLSEFFEIYSILNFYSIESTWLFYIFKYWYSCFSYIYSIIYSSFL